MTKRPSLDEIEARCEAATSGPWFIAGNNSSNTLRCVHNEATNIAVLVHEKDSSFIAAARTDIPALIARVRELEDGLRLIAADIPWGTREDLCVRRLLGLSATEPVASPHEPPDGSTP